MKMMLKMCGWFQEAVAITVKRMIQKKCQSNVR